MGYKDLGLLAKVNQSLYNLSHKTLSLPTSVSRMYIHNTHLYSILFAISYLSILGLAERPSIQEKSVLRHARRSVNVEFGPDIDTTEDEEVEQPHVKRRSIDVQFGDNVPTSEDPASDLNKRSTEVQFGDNLPDPEEVANAHIDKRSTEVQFGDDLPNEEESSEPRLARRSTEVQFGDEPPTPEDVDTEITPDSTHARRSTDVTFGPDLPNNEASDPTIVPRELTDMQKLIQADLKCAQQNRPHRRSLTLTPRSPMPPSDSLFDNHGAAAWIVDMGRAYYLDWNHSPRNVIGTIGLCGCTAVAILGGSGAIVAHISPNLDLLDAQLQYLGNLFTQNLANQMISAYLFIPAVNGNTLVPEFQDHIRLFLEGLFLANWRVIPYTYNEAGRARDGTVVVQMVANLVSVYLDDNMVSGI